MSRPSSRRSTSNGNVRGSSKDRLARKLWLLATFGDGTTAPCRAEDHHVDCPGTVTIETITVDRIQLGIDGGRYVRGNIRPAAHCCNSMTGGRVGAARLHERKRS